MRGTALYRERHLFPVQGLASLSVALSPNAINRLYCVCTIIFLLGSDLHPRNVNVTDKGQKGCVIAVDLMDKSIKLIWSITEVRK